MVKLEWGKKHACGSCGAKFYDMRKDLVVCPACGTELSQKPLLKARRTTAAKATPKAEPPSPTLEDAEFPEGIEDVEIDDEEVEMDDAGDDDLLVDQDMDEDVSEVAEHIETAGEKE